MNNRSTLHSLTQIYRCVGTKAPVYLTDKIKYVSSTHEHNTRQIHEILIGQFNTRYGQQSFFTKVSSMFNKLMYKLKLKQQSSVATFKKKVFNYLLACQKNETDHGLF